MKRKVVFICLCCFPILSAPRLAVPPEGVAFVSPLVAVFVLASKTTDAFQMAKWSSRNVIPAKIALGVMFAILGTLMLLNAAVLGIGTTLW